MKNLILFIILFSSLCLKAQNLISNPDFSIVDVYYNQGKQVNPKDWRFFNYPQFSHVEKNESDNFRLSNYRNTPGIVQLNIIPSSNGITTKLLSRLDSGKNYIINIEMKIDRITLNSDFSGKSYFMDGKPLDSIDYDYNYPVSLITYFSESEPRLEAEKRDFVLFDLPENVNPDKPEWFNIHKIYTANGSEDYFSIGTFYSEDYVEILRTVKKDTIDYYHKFARYLIRNVIVYQIIDSTTSAATADGNGETSKKIADSFDPISILKVDSNQKFILRKVNFELSSFELTDSAKHEIDKIAFFMKENAIFNLKITGHTDSIGTHQFNQTLSEKRANAVYGYLVGQGIQKSRLSYEGKGEDQPLDDKLFEKNFGVNRRVEFLLMKWD